MQVNTLPNKNLYQLCAFFGIILFVYNLYYTSKVLNEYHKQMVEWNGTLKKFNFQMEIATDDLNKIVGQIIVTEVQAKKDMLRADAFKKLKVLKKKQWQNKTTHDQISLKLDKLSRDSLYLRLGAFSGLALMIFGFYKWYRSEHTLLVKMLERRSVRR